MFKNLFEKNKFLSFLVILMDDSNPNAENAIDGAISYAVKNNIGKVTTKEIVRVADEEAYKTIEQGDFIFFCLC